MLRTHRLSWAQIEHFELRPARARGLSASSVAHRSDGKLVTVQALSPAIVGRDPILARLAELNERLTPAPHVKPSRPAQ